MCKDTVIPQKKGFSMLDIFVAFALIPEKPAVIINNVFDYDVASVPVGKKIARAPIPKNNPASWISAEDYPASARKQGRGGVVSFQLEIDRKGMVTGCDIIQSSGHRDLDMATCAAMALRGEFEPARDAKGKKALGAYVGSISWKAKNA
jgi:TonB family protein